MTTFAFGEPSRSIPLEHELVPYSCFSPGSVGSLLVLAPHPDDEVLACGGLLALIARGGGRAKVVVCSDGGLGGTPAIREAESRAAARILLGARHLDAMSFWRLPDRGLLFDETLSGRIVEAVRDFRPDWVLAPSPFEVHPDHRAVCRAAVLAVRQAMEVDATLVFYEVGQPLMPNVMVDISGVLAIKQEAMRCFVSQIAQQAYHDQIEGLNRYRSYTLGPAVTHAEAFWQVTANELSAGVGSLLESVRERLWARL